LATTAGQYDYRTDRFWMTRRKITRQPAAEGMPQDVKAPKSERSRDSSDVVDHVGGQLIERAGATFGPAHVHRDRLVSGGRQGMH
jgi:hypothetical protein